MKDALIEKVFFLFLILIFHSCEKKRDLLEDTLVFGKIVDYRTNLPLGGVSILKIYRCNNELINDTTLISKTDEEGNFEVKVNVSQSVENPESGCYEYLMVHLSDYNDCAIVLKRGAINESNIRLVKNAFLKIHLKNINPCNSDDWFNFGIRLNYGWSQEYWSFYKSNNLDTILKLKVMPNYSHSIWWNSTKCNIKTFGDEDIYFTSGDTIYRSIFF